MVKIINKSLFFRIEDLNATLHSVTETPTANGKDIVFKNDLELDNKIESWSLNRLNIKHLIQPFVRLKRVNSRTDYAIKYSTLCNLDEFVDSPKFILLEVRGKHPLSGATKTYYHEFSHKSCFKDGEFMSGNTFEIV